MFGTTDQPDMEWNCGIHGDCGPPFTTLELGNFEDMAMVQGKLLNAAQVAEVDEVYNKTPGIFLPIVSSVEDGDPYTHKPPHFWAGHLKNMYSRQEEGRVAAVLLPIALDHGAPLPDVHGELPRDGVAMDTPLADGNPIISRAAQTERNLGDQPLPPPLAGPTVNDPTSLAVVPSLHLSTKPTSPSGSPARKKTHKCQCGSKFDRISRAEACFNRHQKEKPYKCNGVCGNPKCARSFISMDQLWSHTKTPCPYCSTLISKGNIAKHRKTCSSRSASSVPGPSRSFQEKGTSDTPTPNAAISRRLKSMKTKARG